VIVLLLPKTKIIISICVSESELTGYDSADNNASCFRTNCATGCDMKHAGKSMSVPKNDTLKARFSLFHNT